MITLLFYSHNSAAVIVATVKVTDENADEEYPEQEDTGKKIITVNSQNSESHHIILNLLLMLRDII